MKKGHGGVMPRGYRSMGVAAAVGLVVLAVVGVKYFANPTATDSPVSGVQADQESAGVDIKRGTRSELASSGRSDDEKARTRLIREGESTRSSTLGAASRQEIIGRLRQRITELENQSQQIEADPFLKAIDSAVEEWSTEELELLDRHGFDGIGDAVSAAEKAYIEAPPEVREQADAEYLKLLNLAAKLTAPPPPPTQEQVEAQREFLKVLDEEKRIVRGMSPEDADRRLAHVKDEFFVQIDNQQTDREGDNPQ